MSRVGFPITANHIIEHKDKLVPMYGITGINHEYPRKWLEQPERIYASLPISLKRMYLGKDTVIPSPVVHIPVSFDVSKSKGYCNVRFERRDLVLIGMDILREFNFGVDIMDIDGGTPFFKISRAKRVKPLRTKPSVPIQFID